MCFALLASQSWAAMQTTAIIRPNAVLYMASEIPRERMVCLSAALAAERAEKHLIRPETVPMRPISVAMLAMGKSDGMRFVTIGVTSSVDSSMADEISASPRFELSRPDFI